MKFLFVCRASTRVGLGHLMRSRTLAEHACRLHDVEMIVIGPPTLSRLTAALPFRVTFAENDTDLFRYVFADFDAVFYDTLVLDPDTLGFLKEHGRLAVSISPIFEHMAHMDMVFSRTRYGSKRDGEIAAEQYLGLEYTIIQSSCRRIETRAFRENLQRSVPSLAISMGGGDAANRTLQFLRSLRQCEIRATFWVMLGEGYGHSYDPLMRALEDDQRHEIIVAKTNRSMWQILSNCTLAILPGGITTYEAAYAGLPTVNVFEKEDHTFLVRELVEAGVCLNAGLLNEANLAQLNRTLSDLFNNRDALLGMHETSRGIIDGKGCARILDIVEQAAERR